MDHRRSLLVIASTLPVGGAERVLETLAVGLPSEGVDVALLSLREFGEIGQRIVHATRGPAHEMVAPRRYDLRQVAAVAASIREMQPDVVLNLDHSNALLYGGLGARRAGLHATFTPIHSMRRPDGSPSLGRIDRWTVRLSRAVVALSPIHARYVVDELGVPADRVRIVPNGVDVERFHPEGPVADDVRALGDGRFRLGILAALRPEKNHDFLLRTLASMEPSDRPRLVVIGDGPLRDELRALCTSLGLDDTVDWLGTRHDVPAVLRAIDAIVLPSRSVVETFPVSVLEAMACGRPTIVSDVGAVRDMIEDGTHGCVVPSGDDVALVAAIASLRDDPARGATMGAAARARVTREFRREVMIEGYAGLIHELADAWVPVG